MPKSKKPDGAWGRTRILEIIARDDDLRPVRLAIERDGRIPGPPVSNSLLVIVTLLTGAVTVHPYAVWQCFLAVAR